MDEEEYRTALRQKLVEEAEEYRESGDPMELADVLEVLYAILALEDLPFSQIEALRVEKQRERGGFQDRLFLHHVEKEKG